MRDVDLDNLTESGIRNLPFNSSSVDFRMLEPFLSGMRRLDFTTKMTDPEKYVEFSYEPLQLTLYTYNGELDTFVCWRPEARLLGIPILNLRADEAVRQLANSGVDAERKGNLITWVTRSGKFSGGFHYCLELEDGHVARIIGYHCKNVRNVFLECDRHLNANDRVTS